MYMEKIAIGKNLPNNLLDLESALSTVLEFGYEEKDILMPNKYASVILKHNNPCGAAIHENQLQAYIDARDCDPVSAFGGIVAFNTKVSKNVAEEISKKKKVTQDVLSVKIQNF